ncbi:Dut dUTPase [uncultured Caudovirales phage]|uniref:dUTP diphosphatase n=1 Tax=uncultured Caudovirales phage TaxID=2100421 RepID=A0A6J5SWW4_9CAUD|nr:Dut dUTPase [uncultured Caudovirales phage]
MKISRIRDVKIPTRGTPKSAGIDFFVPNDYPELILLPGNSALIPTGIKADIPTGYMLTAFNKSGVATKQLLIKGAEVCDEDYQGEIHIHVINVGTTDQLITPGQKLIQFVLVPVFYDIIEDVPFEELYSETTERGEGGFGSTGTH